MPGVFFIDLAGQAGFCRQHHGFEGRLFQKDALEVGQLKSGHLKVPGNGLATLAILLKPAFELVIGQANVFLQIPEVVLDEDDLRFKDRPREPVKPQVAFRLSPL